MRISDSDRNAAIKALGEHLAAGRITLDEYGDRTAKVTLTRTAGELGGLFEDLPAPHPTLSVTPVGDATVATRQASGALMPPARGQLPVGDTRSTAQKLVAAAAAASVFVAIALFFITGAWQWFLLIPAISAIAGSIWGPDWKDPGGGAREARRQLRRDIRDGRWDPDD
jgi:hypothetical protein